MAMLHRDRALSLADSLIERSKADETEVVIHSEQERFVRFADTGPTQNADRHRHQVAVRARFQSDDGWCEARATCDGTGEAAMSGALDRATQLARIAPANSDLGPLGGAFEGQDSLANGALDGDTLAHTFDAKATWIRAALAQCKDQALAPAGMASTSGHSMTVANSAGRAVHDAHTRASLLLTAAAQDFNGGAGFANCLRTRVSEIDAEAVFERAVHKAVMNREAVDVGPGAYTVLLEPSAVSSILLFASYVGFGAQEVHEESSFLCGRMGEQLFPAGLSIADDAANEVFPGFAMDGEGSPRQRVELVRAGVPTGPVTDADWARRLSVPNTGHAVQKPSSAGPRASNLCVAAGNETTAQLLAGIERGLLITQFHYSNLIDPRDILLTGMTRNGTFLIEEGEIVGAVKNLRFTESLVNAFGNISGLSSEREVAGALFGGAIVTPSMRIDGFRFTSSTDF